ncbi:MAG TPA: carboxypeptidase-like regulatory domain-containing protein [Acidobacteriaceae bacterium]|nr:carboxypeptidase-like regulatory domain-containing protein [Acidobacteriaceae bacterium]
MNIWLTCAAGFALATTAVAQQSGYAISGVVVNAVTGAPLDRAEVTLSTTGAGSSNLEQTATAEDGEFSFNGLPAGKYGVQASRRGYLTADYEEHEGYFTAIVTGPHLASEGLRFALMPYATIGGTVSDDNGDPVSDAQVKLFRQDDDDGETKVESADSTITDDAGSFEFSRLHPGTYYLDVSATPWYAVHPDPRSDLSGNGGADEQPASQLDVAYPLTFYPNAPDSGSASPITVAAGDRAQANFSLHAVPAIHIQVYGALGPGGHGVPSPMLSQQEFGDEQSVERPVPRISGKDNLLTFDFGGLAPGNYTLQQVGRGSASEDLAGDGILHVPPVPSTVDVRGRFAMASGAPLPERAVAALRPVDGHPTYLNTPLGRDGSFDFANVPPGTYEVHLSGTFVVVGMAASGGEVHGSDITVGGDPVLLAATLASGSTTLNGYAVRDNKGLGGALVLLVPSDPGANNELIRRDQSDSDGSFTLYNVVPGTYILMAIEDGWTLAWKHRDAIAAYLKHGVTVQVPENQRTLNLASRVTVQ